MRRVAFILTLLSLLALPLIAAYTYFLTDSFASINLRILAQTDHSILPKAITDSRASRSPIPVQGDQ